MIALTGTLYDGLSSQATPVALRLLDDGTLRVEGVERPIALHARTLRISERLGRTPRWLEVGDGARIELPDSDELETWLGRHRRSSASWLARIEGRWAAVAAAVVLTVGLGFVVLRHGLPWLASRLAQHLPESVDREIGEWMIENLDESIFAASELAETRRAEIEKQFEALLAQAALAQGARLELRKGGSLGANAFALPNGIVVLTDELVALAADDADLAAVIAHELGHVHHRHGLRTSLQDTGVALLTAAVFGDFVSVSAVAGALPMVLAKLSFSREFELEADAFSQRLLLASDLDPEALGRILVRLDESHGGASSLPYLSTHPATEERIRLLRERR